MSDHYKYDGLNKLSDSLDATGVISDEYRRHIFGFVLMAVKEAYEAGRKAERESPAQVVYSERLRELADAAADHNRHTHATLLRRWADEADA